MLNVASTSAAAYRSIQASGALEDRKLLVTRLVREIGGGTAFDLMNYVEKNVAFSDMESKFRFVQNIHATVSELTKEGVLKCTGTRINPSSNQAVKYYEINEGEILAQPNVEKGYKKRFEAAQAEL